MVWLNIGHARSYYAEDDRIIAAEAAKYPNMTVADWADTVPKDGVVVGRPPPQARRAPRRWPS